MYGAEASPTTTTPSVPPELLLMLSPEDQAALLREKKPATVYTPPTGMPMIAKIALGALAAYGGYMLVMKAMAGGMYTPSTDAFERGVSRMNRRR